MCWPEFSFPFAQKELQSAFQGHCGQIIKAKNALIIFASTNIVLFNYMNSYQEQ